jgi:hypothetical protein
MEKVKVLLFAANPIGHRPESPHEAAATPMHE